MNKKMTLQATGFKATGNGMEFTCYGNVKGNIDHARDVTMPGAYEGSIARHKAKGTMPKMFWGHDSRQPPVGAWTDMKEDQRGLWMKGEFADTERGRELYQLMKMGALDSFSIGYIVINEKWNYDGDYNELLELEIMETSIVNFACNEESRLETIKSKVNDGQLPTKRELQKFLQEAGLSKRQAESVVNRYEPKAVDAWDELAKHFTSDDLSNIM